MCIAEQSAKLSTRINSTTSAGSDHARLVTLASAGTGAKFLIFFRKSQEHLWQ
jgi:hypothetical protein